MRRPPLAVEVPVTRRHAIRLYDALEVSVAWPDSWRRHPLTNHQFPLHHWATLSEGGAAAGDIKDLWEIGRLGWLTQQLPAASDDPAVAEHLWLVLESFIEANPPFLGPQWMCGQESALRGIAVAAMATTLHQSRTTTDRRRALAAELIAATVGRVRPTIGYALSQRNNHAVSEAAFLWTATIVLDGLPDTDEIRAEASSALQEVAVDQFYEDGAYAQHSPTYQRLALHALLWILAVARSSGVTPPPGVEDAVARSQQFLTTLIERDTGRMPNLGGNDGALLFQLTRSPIQDFRPVLAHAAAASGVPSPFKAGRWDEEAQWFGLAAEPAAVAAPLASLRGVSHHVHRGVSSHTILRAGPLRHRPAHADQLHIDIWIASENVAADPGSFRYTAPPPWGNALAEEAVHNVLRVPGEPQAQRRGRFFWLRWTEATVMAAVRTDAVDATLVELKLRGRASLRRLLVRVEDTHIVLDRASDEGALVRWNLPAGTDVHTAPGLTVASGAGWHARFVHSGIAQPPEPDEADPRSGWLSPTYAVRLPLTALELRVDEAGCATSSFAPAGAPLDLTVPPAALDAADDAELARLLAS